jgi:hypothetical protein
MGGKKSERRDRQRKKKKEKRKRSHALLRGTFLRNHVVGALLEPFASAVRVP